MTTDIFLRLPDIKGESAHKDFYGQIELLSLQWSSSKDINGQGESELILTKYVDASSPLIAALHHQQDLTAAVLTCFRSHYKPIVPLRLTLGGVRVVAMTMGASKDDDGLVEQLTLSYQGLKIEVQPQGMDGTPGDIVEYGYSSLPDRGSSLD